MRTRTTEKLIAILLAAIMFFTTLSTIPLSVKAETAVAGQNSAAEYIASAESAVNTTNQIIKALGVQKWGDFGKELTSYIGYIKLGLNISNTILKFLGFGKKGSTEPTIEEKMYYEILNIQQEMTKLQSDIQAMMDKLLQTEIKDELKDRRDQAQLYQNRWAAFESDSLDPMNRSISDRYKPDLTTALIKWFADSDSRSGEAAKGIDNSIIKLYYQDNPDTTAERKEQPVLNPDPDNNVPEGMTGSPVITLGEQCLPVIEEAYFNINTYRDVWKESMAAKITEALGENGSVDNVITVDHAATGDFAYIFTQAGWVAASDQQKSDALNTLFDDAHEALMYRLSIIVTRQNNDNFVNAAITNFNNYCTNLCQTATNALDAVTKVMQYTHGFEGEIAEQYKELIGNMTIQTAEYATFVLDLIGKSNSIDDATAKTVAENWDKTAKALEDALNNNLTGHSNYSYVSNGLVEILPLRLDTLIRAKYKDFTGGKLNYYEIHTEPTISAGYCKTPFPYDCRSVRLGTVNGMVQYNLYLANASETGVPDFVKQVDDFGGNTYATYSDDNAWWSQYRKLDYSKENLLLDWSGLTQTTESDNIPIFIQNYHSGDFNGSRQANNREIKYSAKMLYNKNITGDILDRNTNVLRTKQYISELMFVGETGSKDWSIASGPDGVTGRNTQFWEYDYSSALSSNDCGFKEHSCDYIYTLVSVPVTDLGPAKQVLSVQDIKNAIAQAPEKEQVMTPDDYKRLNLGGDIIVNETDDIKIEIPENKHVVIDLKGKQFKWSQNKLFKVNKNATLELVNGKVAGTGTGHIQEGVVVAENGCLKMTDVTLSDIAYDGIGADQASSIILNNCVLENITGTALRLDSCENISIDNTIIRNNGQALYIFGDTGNLAMNADVIENNSNKSESAGMFLKTLNTGEESVITQCTFKGNTAQNIGGALTVTGDGSVSLQDCAFIGNKASKGSAICKVGSSSIRLKNCSITENEDTDDDGGAVHLTSGTLDLDGTMTIRKNKTADIYMDSDAMVTVQPGLSFGSVIGIYSKQLENDASVIIGTSPTSGKYAHYFEPNQKYSGFMTKVTEKDGQLRLEKVTTASLKEHVEAYKQNPDQFDNEAMMGLLSDYELLSEDEHYRKDLDDVVIRTIPELKEKICAVNHRADCDDHIVLLLGDGTNGTADPNWRHIITSETLEAIPEAIKMKLGDDWKVLAADDIEVISYNGKSVEGQFTIGFTGKDFAAYKDKEAVVLHLTQFGATEELKATWNEEKQCFTVTTDSFSPFVLAVNTTSVDTGITETNTDLPIMLGFIAFAIAGLSVVLIRRKKQ